jgi:Flp pilus assembly protein TadB
VVSDAEARAYAWNWFSLHAGQRLQLVNFWLVAVSFLAAAFVQSLAGGLHAIAAGVSLVGAVASVAFVRLDARTRQLTRVAEDALRVIEQSWAGSGGDDSILLVARSHDATRGWVDSYRVIIQGMQLSVAAVFFAAFCYAVAS